MTTPSLINIFDPSVSQGDKSRYPECLLLFPAPNPYWNLWITSWVVFLVVWLLTHKRFPSYAWSISWMVGYLVLIKAWIPEAE